MRNSFITAKTFSLLMIVVCLLLQGCSTKPLSGKKQQELAGKVFVITGASSGLGKGIALQAARYKATVVIVARNEKALNDVAAEIRAFGGNVAVIPADVSNKEQMEQLMTGTLERFGHIDVWINNAGIAAIGAFWETPLEDQVRVIDVNLKGVLYGSYLAVRQFRTQGYGTLINIGSVESEIPTAYQAAYSASKAAVRSIGLVLRQELRLAGIKTIKVITISPWALDTPLWGHTATYTGHAPRMIMMDAPQKAVNTVMHAATGKKREMPVGIKAHLSYGAHRIFPAWTERLGSNVAHKYQADQTPQQADTKGNLYKSKSDGAGVEGGFRKLMKVEKKQRKQKK
jgi:short-subunit dehydrogenase